MPSDALHPTARLGPVFDALANPRRRDALRTLLRDGTATTVDELADCLERIEADRGVPTSADAIRLSLYHVHLPVLAAADLVVVDGETVGPRRANGAASPALAYADRLLGTVDAPDGPPPSSHRGD